MNARLERIEAMLQAPQAPAAEAPQADAPAGAEVYRLPTAG
jgi:hypothetical protein